VKLEYAVPCRAIEKLADGTFVILGAETNGFLRREFPQPIAVMLLVCISQAHVDTTEGHLVIEVLNPAMEPCAPEIGHDIRVPRAPLLPEGWSARMLTPARVVFMADRPGGYSIELAVGTSSLSVPLLVIEPPAVEPAE
jgi:hypothetical protein